MHIFVSGSLAFDRIMDFPGKFADHILPEKIHVLNVSFQVNGLRELLGGTAGNIAYNLALLGEKPVILSSAGMDFQRYEDWLVRHGLPLQGIHRVEEEWTAAAYITTDLADNQITGFNPGAMKYPSKFRFDGINPERSLAIVAPGNVEDMISYARTYRELKISYLFDPGQQIPVLPRADLEEAITGAELLISNDYELEMIMSALEMDMDGLLEKTGTVITTFGDKGSRVVTKQGQVHIGISKPTGVVDPTGAGDAFRAGLIKGLVEGKTPSEACEMGAVCAGFAVEHYGTQEHAFTREEFRRRYEESFAG